MVVRRRKTTGKYRGTRNHGAGNMKNKRGAGGRGGKGMAGSCKHRWTWIVKYKPDHFGVHGFNPMKRKSLKEINLGDLEDLVEKSKLQKDSNGLYELSLPDYKVLGGGKINVPIIIKAGALSESAKKKIESSGGKIAQ